MLPNCSTDFAIATLHSAKTGLPLRQQHLRKLHFVNSALGSLTIILATAIGTVSGQEKKPETKSPEKSSREAIALYSDAANFQNNGAFELAVEEWGKFLKEHAKDPLVPKAQFYLAVCNVQLKQFDKSVTILDALLKSHPDFEQAEDAYLNLGWSQYSLAAADAKNYVSAQATFETLLKKFQKGKYADQANYFLGDCLYHQGKKKEAIVQYEGVLKEFAKSALRCEAAYALGVAYEELEQFADAGRAYDIYLSECSSGALFTEVRMRKAETVSRQGKFAEAERMFAEVAAVPGFSLADHARMRQADCLVRSDKLVEAAEVFGKLSSEFPESTHANAALTAAGRCLYRAEKFSEAAPWFQRMVDKGTAEAGEAAHWLARIHLKSKQSELAIAVAEKALPLLTDSPWRAHVLLDLGDAMYELPARRSDAIALFAQLAKELPAHELAPQALYNAAFGYLESKQYDLAVQHAQKFVTNYGMDRLLPDVKFIAAESQLLLQQYAAAEAAYQQLVAEFPQHPDADKWLMRAGLTSLLQKKYAVVVDMLTPKLTGMKSADLRAESQFLMGSSLLGMDKTAAAADAFAASLAEQPQWRQADETLLGLARAQRKLDKISEARATIQKLIKDHPQSAVLDQGYYRLGEYAFATDDLPGALAAYDEVIKRWPDSTFVPFALYGKGWTLLKLKQFPAASEALTALLTRFADHSLTGDARFARAMSRRQSNDFSGAIDDLNTYLKANPDLDHQSDAIFERGLAESGLKQWDAAGASYRQILKDHPQYSGLDKVRYELAWVLKTQEKNEEAAAEFASLAKSHPDSAFAAESYFHVGESQYDKQQYEDAVKTYTSALAKVKSAELKEKAAYKLGWSHFQLKQYEPAMVQFTEQLAASPTGSLANDGQFMKTECLFRLKKYAEALAGFRETRKLPMLPAKLEVLVLLHGGQSACQLKNWEQGLEWLAEIPKRFAESPYLAEAHYELGWARQNLKRSDEALKDYEIAASKSRDAVGARARFMIGEVLFEKKQFDEAIKQFQRVMYTFGGDNSADDVKIWQAQAGFEAARCWEVQIQSESDGKRKMQCLAEATRHYTYVVEKHPQSNWAADARKRLEALGKL